MKSTQVNYLFAPTEEQELVQAIREAEQQTSGEIRIHIDKECNMNQLDRAKEVFNFLGMQKTQERNGVLLHISVQERGFAIVGDKGIDAVVARDFWEAVKNKIINQFQQENYKEGLVQGIQEIAKQLKAYFPAKDNDANELPNEISKA